MKAVLVGLGIVLSVGACKKGGGTGGWLVGVDGLMVNVQDNGDARGYPLSSSETLNAIACRYSGEAWVAGTSGTLLYTHDAGASWLPQAVPTSADLRALATQDFGPVFVAGDGVFLTSSDTGAHWTQVGDGTVSFRAVAAAERSPTVLAVSEGGAVFSLENDQLVNRASVAGARAIAVSPDGRTALLVGDGLISRSGDGGVTWSRLAGGEGVRFDDVRIDETGQALAAGSGGAIAHISAAGDVVIQRVGAADLHTIHLPDDEDEGEAGFAAGDGGQVVITLDRGTTWSQGPNVGRTVLSLDQIGGGHR